MLVSAVTKLQGMIKMSIILFQYYFGDINLPRDKFMLEKIKQDDGWIPMSVMLTFQRLAKLTTDPKVVVKALFHSDLMEVGIIDNGFRYRGIFTSLQRFFRLTSLEARSK